MIKNYNGNLYMLMLEFVEYFSLRMAPCIFSKFNLIISLYEDRAVDKTTGLYVSSSSKKLMVFDHF